MLETYEAYADYEDVMRMTEEMVAYAAQEALGTTRRRGEGRGDRPHAAVARACRSARRIAEQPAASTRSRGRATTAAAARRARRATASRRAHDTSWAQLVDHMLSHYVEPHLVQPTFLVDYPVELSPLARADAGRPDAVERFEAFCGGMEIAQRLLAS